MGENKDETLNTIVALINLSSLHRPKPLQIDPTTYHRL